MSVYEAVVYKAATGEVTGYYISSAVETLAAGYSALFVANPQQYRNSHYVASGTLMPKTLMTPTVIGTTFSNLPVPCTLRTNGNAFEVTDGVAELDYAYPGTYAVEIEAVPYFKYTTTVTKA